MKINKYWILAVIGVFLVVGGTVMVTNHIGATSSNQSTNNSSHKETDSEYATKKFDEIKKTSKTSNVIVVLYEPGKQYTPTFLDMVKTAEKNINYSGKPKVIYFKGDSFVKNWLNQGYAASSGTVNTTQNYLMKTNILVLKKGADLKELATYELHRDQIDNDASHNGGTAIDAPTGMIGIIKGLEFNSGEINNNWLSEMTTNEEVKEDIQEHLVNFAFSWFNDSLFHRN